MVKVKCPIPPCDYETDDLDPAVVAALITAQSELRKNNNVPAKVQKVKRPTISAAGTSEEWSYFLTRWNDYAEATQIKDKELVIQLLECCDENLRRDLTRYHGGSLTSKPKDEVIQAIRQLAVREDNIMVARATLQNMTQDRDETVRAFGARLRGQASVCKFLLECECDRDINYTDSVLRDVLIRGLADSDIQLELLGNQNQNMTLEEVFKFVEAKEAGKHSASKLLDSQGAEAASSYRRNKTASRTKQDKPKSKPSEICSYCGKTGHGTKAPAYIRKKQYDAYGKTCSMCKYLNHFASVYKSTRQSDKNTSTEHESAVFDSLFQESRNVIIKEIELGVRIFDPSKQTCLATDWSKSGIGFWLFQKHCDCGKIIPFCCRHGWKITLVGSRFTSGAESRYAPVEGEALAVADALEKSRYFVLGCKNLTIAMDHKPLLKIFGDRSLENIPNARLRNLK